jgi:hypothetical protein
MDCDRIIVMEAGQYVLAAPLLPLTAVRVAEFDTPSNLLQDPDSFFSKLVAETTGQEQRKLKGIARRHSSKRSNASAPAQTSRRPTIQPIAEEEPDDMAGPPVWTIVCETEV